jgi:hypothetical protein
VSAPLMSSDGRCANRGPQLNATRVMCGRQTYAGPWDIFKRVIKSGEESYNLVESFDDKEPNPEQITKAIRK